MRENYLAARVVFGGLGLVLATGAAGLDYDEAIDGDLSGDEANPTVWTLDLGANTISGTSTASPLDRDFFVITIGPGQSLTSLFVTAQTPDPNGTAAFLAIDDQFGFSTLISADDYLGTALIGADEVGTDILPELGDGIFGGTGFTGPLGEGTYSFWYQEVSGPTSYSYTATVIPEPGSAVALLLGAGGLLLRRRR